MPGSTRDKLQLWPTCFEFRNYNIKNSRPLSDCRMLGAPNVKKISSSFDATSSARFNISGLKMQNF
ncbi:hypothetical protein T12_12368, partial [Trichinella patagoniensis]